MWRFVIVHGPDVCLHPRVVVVHTLRSAIEVISSMLCRTRKHEVYVRHREHFLGVLLAYHVVVKILHQLRNVRNPRDNAD